MHDSPAPVQTKNEAASLIKRFWHKLIGSGFAAESESEPEVKVSPARVERVRSTDESQPGRGRNNRRGGRNQGPRNQESRQSQEPRPERAQQAQEAKPEQNKEPRPSRNIRGPGRNVRRNLAPVNDAGDETSIAVKLEAPMAANVAPITDAALVTQDVAATIDEQTQPTARKSASRRGPNRRRPRNPNYKKAEGEGDSSNGDTDLAATDSRSEDRPAQSRSYDSDFAERAERTERSEPPQAPVMNTPEPPKIVTESVPKASEE
jgi:ribonuclease E